MGYMVHRGAVKAPHAMTGSGDAWKGMARQGVAIDDLRPR